jgi:hypothetical protein
VAAAGGERQRAPVGPPQVSARPLGGQRAGVASVGVVQ